MKLYRYKTFRTSYYFPQMTENLRYMYGLYAAYGSRLSRAYWWLFRHCGVVRWLNGVNCEKLEFPYQKIVELEGKDSLMAFNLGTPGAEQKISILGFDTVNNEKFFAKYSEKVRSKELTRNEIRIYQMLEDSDLTPRLLGTNDTGEYVWMKASFVKGSHLETMQLTEDIVALAIQLSQYHISADYAQKNGLKTCLSHGDFCPWNMLVDEGKIRLIDWEMAAERPLGYDIFKYVCQCSRLFDPQKPFDKVIAEHKDMIDSYFGKLNIKEWSAYYDDFISTPLWQ